jgi:phosphoglycolate phosphatase
MATLTPPRCILFDLDGTLVDSVADISASANHVRVAAGMDPLPESELTRYVGDGAPKLMQRAMAGRYEVPAEIEGEDLRKAIADFRAHYIEHCLIRTAPYPGVMEGLRALMPRPMAIVSNKPEPMCVKIADGLEMAEYFGRVVGARPSVAVKPDPALLIATLEEMGLSASGRDIWMVGDSVNDIRAARAIGATAVAVSWGLTSVERLEEEKPDVMVDEFDDFVRICIQN